MKKWGLLVIAVALSIASCSLPAGPAGPAGPT